MDNKRARSLEVIQQILDQFRAKNSSEDEFIPLKRPVSEVWEINLDEPKKEEIDPDPFQRTRTLPEDFALREVEDREKGRIYYEPVNEAYKAQFPDRAVLGEWDQLIWHAARVTATTGLKIKVFPTGSWSNHIRNWDNYQVSAGWTHAGTNGFMSTWTYLNGMQHGAEAWRDDNQVKEKE